MPRYFFHFARDAHRVMDEEGVDFETVDDAKRWAKVVARELSGSGEGELADGAAIVLAADDGTDLLTVPL